MQRRLKTSLVVHSKTARDLSNSWGLPRATGIESSLQAKPSSLRGKMFSAFHSNSRGALMALRTCSERGKTRRDDRRKFAAVVRRLPSHRRGSPVLVGPNGGAPLRDSFASQMPTQQERADEINLFRP
jgi:hypothetical protein